MLLQPVQTKSLKMNRNIKQCLIQILFITSFVRGTISSIRPTRSVNWNGRNWALGCDFRGKDFTNANIPADQCGGKCANTPSCTHFTWTRFNGQTCWMKSGSVSPSDAVETGDSSMVCGYMENVPNPGPGSNDLVGQTHHGVLTTRHPATEAGSCQLPEGDYASGIHPVALGNVDALGDLKHQPGLCGHILRINCGPRTVDIIVTNANLGGGLDLYASSWDLATGGKPPGQDWCSVQLTSRNPFNFQGSRCYYAPGSEMYNDYYHELGVFNTGSRIVRGATLDGRQGSFNSITAYFSFHGGPISQEAQITFSFQDGSSQSFKLKDCQREKKLHIWS